MKKMSIIALLHFFLGGCVMLMPMDTTAPRVFTYDYQVSGKSKSVLWSRARDYFVDHYQDDEGDPPPKMWRAS